MKVPRVADLAAFARLAIGHRLLPPQVVVAWADGVIAAEDVPPLWAIDLSLADGDEEEVDALLRQVPGEADEVLAVSMLLALLGRKWKGGEIGLDRLEAIGSSLYWEASWRVSEGAAQWRKIFDDILCLECAFDRYGARLCSKQHVRGEARRTFEAFEAYADMLPPWADR